MGKNMKNGLLPSIVDELMGENMHMYLITFLVLILSLVFFVIYRKSKFSRRDILLMGLCDSGKTVIHSQLIHSKFVETHTSINENIGEYLVNKNSLRIIDIPGHERLRGKFFDLYKNTAKGIVFVLDSLTLQKDVKDVAEFLYTILTDSTVMLVTPQILILCNKQDEMLSKGSGLIKALLEKEMNTLRITQSSMLESVDASKTKKVYLGREDKDFDFSYISPFTVEFGETQACSKSTNIESLKKWLNKIA